MQIYLPVAEASVNLYVLLGIGGGVGFLSGLFGVGGGFLLTPLLLFIGVPAPVAVATGSNQVVGSSFSAMLTHWKKRTVDPAMGIVLLVGGLIGSALGVWAFSIMRTLGQIDLVISLAYIAILGTVGGLMLIECIRGMLPKPAIRPPSERPAKRKSRWRLNLPFKYRFERSGLRISVIPVMLLGFGIGFIAALLGIGGGFILVPAMIYMLGMRTGMVVGTSLFQIVPVTAFTTVLHAVTTQTVDIILALILLIGGVTGAQIGAQAGMRLRAEQLRILLALVILAVAAKLTVDLVFEPSELYSINAIDTWQ